MGKVKIRNMVKSRVVINEPSLRMYRAWERKGAIRTIEMEDLEELIYNPGVEYMFREGILVIEDPKKDEILVKLGLQDEDGTNQIVILSEEDMKELMGATVSLATFREKISELPKGQLNELVNYCVDNKITNYEKVNILKSKTGKDILSMIRLLDADKEEVEEN